MVCKAVPLFLVIKCVVAWFISLSSHMTQKIMATLLLVCVAFLLFHCKSLPEIENNLVFACLVLRGSVQSRQMGVWTIMLILHQLIMLYSRLWIKAIYTNVFGIDIAHGKDLGLGIVQTVQTLKLMLVSETWGVSRCDITKCLFFQMVLWLCTVTIVCHFFLTAALLAFTHYKINQKENFKMRTLNGNNHDKQPSEADLAEQQPFLRWFLG